LKTFLENEMACSEVEPQPWKSIIVSLMFDPMKKVTFIKEPYI